MAGNNKGKLFIISAPSGSGKTTLCNMLMKKYPSIRYSISYTTRKPRNNEVHGKDYFFTDKETFKAMTENNEFLEWAEVHGNFYGTSKIQIDNALESGTDIILDIDPQGAMQMREKVTTATYIFITAPSFNELKSRLINRGTESDEHISLRMENAKKEVEFFKFYDYLIVNDATDVAFNQLESIYLAEKLRTTQYSNVLEFMNI